MAQNWATVPCFNSVWNLQTLFKDSLNNKLILGFSTVNNICNKPFRGIVSFDGSNFDDLDIGVQTHTGGNSPGSCFAQICIPYNNKSLFGGFFQSVGSNTLLSPGLSYWNGANWDTMAKKPFKFYPNKAPTVSALFKDNNNLWIGGVIDTIYNTPIKNLCYFDGTNYISANMTSKNNAGVKEIIKYKNEIYLSGLFQDIPSTTYSKIVRYSAGEAYPVGNGIQGGSASVQDMIVFNDTLYVAGAFSTADGNVGNHIMKWDGMQFYDAGFGSFHDWGAISKLLIFKNRLYAFGAFTYAADEKAFGAAYYEKGKWVQSKDSTNISGVGGAEILNGQIYASGSFKNIDLDSTFDFFVRLKCPDFDGCINDPINEFINLNIYPNPFKDKIIVENPNYLSSKISLVNTLGQILRDFQNLSAKSELDLSFLASGVYYLKIQNNSQQKVFKIIKE